MKKKYYVNKNAQTNGDHEVHTILCNYLPKPSNRRYLGRFNSCEEAIRRYPRVSGYKNVMCNPPTEKFS